MVPSRTSWASMLPPKSPGQSPAKASSPARRDRDPPQHRLEVDLHRFIRLFGHLGDADHARGVEPPEIAARRDGVVEQPHPGVGREPAEVGVDLRRGERVFGRTLEISTLSMSPVVAPST